jgi:hypothetical protein
MFLNTKAKQKSEGRTSPRFGRRNLKKELQHILQDKELCLLFREWLKVRN